MCIARTWTQIIIEGGRVWGVHTEPGISRLVIQQGKHILLLLLMNFLTMRNQIFESNEPSGAPTTALRSPPQQSIVTSSTPFTQPHKNNIKHTSCGRPTHDNKRGRRATERRRRDIGQLPRHLAQHAEPHVRSNDSRANGIFYPSFLHSFFPSMATY